MEIIKSNDPDLLIRIDYLRKEIKVEDIYEVAAWSMVAAEIIMVELLDRVPLMNCSSRSINVMGHLAGFLNHQNEAINAKDSA